MITDIFSKDNKIYKNTYKLKSRAEREKKQLFIVEGARIVRDALSSELVKYIIISENYTDTDFCVPVYRFSDKLFSQICDTKTPQGIIAVCCIPQANIENVCGNMIIICDGVSDPGNLGTIIRTAECAGASGIIILPGTVDVFSPKTVRSTMGSVFRVPIYFGEYNCIENLINYDIIATKLDGSSNLYDTEFSENVAIIIGNEAHGICDDVLKYANLFVRIPMCGGAESLNAAIAGAIIMYEVYRRKSML